MKERKKCATYNALKEGNLRNRVFSPDFGLIIGDIINHTVHTVTNVTILLISAIHQLKASMSKVLVKYLLSSS